MDAPRLADLLDLDGPPAPGADRFRGATQAIPVQRLFGGLLLGQSLVAAGRTVADGRPVHSLHALFLRPADPQLPVDYAVERIRDGGATSARRVSAFQDGAEVSTALVSFQRTRDGVRHAPAPPPVPPPEDLLPLHERAAAARLPEWWSLPRPVELRHADDPPYPPPVPAREGDRHRVWLRSAAKLPDEPLVHAAALAYASDMTLLEPVFLRHGLDRHEPDLRLASLDHAMWFHRPLGADEWLLYDQDCPLAEGGRVLARGGVFDRAGEQVATVAQEGLLRLPPGSG
ncbi:thioesterase family protein [Saccharopolyspora sp. HNM0983]|uniref:Thioesterase family protein n=1 Tax=Saccharopolyspora montiporae TaxID=2781240 RepID=A0A929B7F6_9PSEU|nr:acyl-CoA thioesterase domain-containing protein [Saccharopolyspora sp. HNM0983]MBE9373210.1 thioesterase family protein [Saccharopolyspora sp. HNM0983]